jgi:predicted 3-demethylubiquinone-9 3-methyltransferase (glyoxalase superfamily)
MKPEVFDTKESNTIKTITPCLWFDNQAEKAVNFYTSIFKAPRLIAFAAITKLDLKPTRCRPEQLLMAD